MGFGSVQQYDNTGPVPYPPQTIRVTPGSLRPPNATILFDDKFDGSQPAWAQLLVGGGFDNTVLNGFLRITPLMAMDGSSGSLQIYAGTPTGTGSALTGATPTCDARRYMEYQGGLKLGCEVWYTYLPQMTLEEGLLGIALSQMDGQLDRRVSIRMDHLAGVVRSDLETSGNAPGPTFAGTVGTNAPTLTYMTLPSPSSADGYAFGKWNHLLLEGDFSQNTVIRAIVNQVDYSNIVKGKALASSSNSVEAAKSGILVWMYNQGTPVRGAEYFLGRATLYSFE